MKRSNISGRKQYFVKGLTYSYDEENDLFYAHKKDANVYSNVVIGEFHLEVTKQGEIVGIEILRASEVLQEYGISKKILEHMDEVRLKVIVRNDSLLVFLLINGLNQECSATIAMNNLNSPINQVFAEV